MKENLKDFLFRGDISELAPNMGRIIKKEEERQARKLIMIPSESYAPRAVREALGSVFQNVYAEGYPPVRATREPESLLVDDAHQLVYYRRYADRRFYKGVEFVDVVESLAGRRAAECFATEEVPPEAIYANVQALSGSAANLSIYSTFMEPGDTLMGLDLFQGGHLTHGSEFNLSGKTYRVVSYGVDPKTEKLDYDQIMELAKKYHPRVIVAGYTAYPWAPDWQKFREIADEVGALLMADIAHTAGLVIGGVYPNPIGVADIVVFTTHKTLCGPRGAVILTTDEDKANMIDMSVFPGAQGGPHVNKFAALCVAFEIAQTEQFKQLQRKIVENARALSDAFKEKGLRVAYGGTNTHIVLIDVSSVEHTSVAGDKEITFPLRGETAARILDLAGIVVNKNTIPGDTLTALASGIRLGTPWVTQRGLDTSDMKTIAGIIYKIVTGIKPYSYFGLAGELPRGKIDLDLLEEAKEAVTAMAEKAGIDIEVGKSGYPYFYTRKSNEGSPLLKISGWRARAFIQEVTTGNMAELQAGHKTATFMLDKDGRLIDEVIIGRCEPDEHGRECYLVQTGEDNTSRVSSWLRGLAEGYIIFDNEDIFRKVQGPVVVENISGKKDDLSDFFNFRDTRRVGEKPGTPGEELYRKYPERFDLTLPYFVGENKIDAKIEDNGKIEWEWRETEQKQLKRTLLFEEHKKLGARIVPFAGWEMPVWYSGLNEEHAAVRTTAGLFDVGHMGCFEVSGPNAISFLDTILSNYAHWLEDGQSCYSYILDPDGNPIDDLMIYRRRSDLFLVVVNAANEDKDWHWFNAVNERRVIIDRERPWIQVEAPAVLKNLKSSEAGEHQLRDMALQGPASLEILKACTDDSKTREKLSRLRRTDLIEVILDGIPVIVARTGYTGEDIGFELFVHPDSMAEFWNMLLERGKSYGIKPCGLASRDSTRTEAGLPLYGHELGGTFKITPAEAGFPGYVKYHKPFFIGRNALLAMDMARERELIRWRILKKGISPPKQGNPVVNKKGQVIGHVTSCSIDTEGNLIGLALVNRRFTEPGTPIVIFVLPPKPKKEKQKTELKAGDRVLLHIEAEIVPRFPPKERKIVRGISDSGD